MTVDVLYVRAVLALVLPVIVDVIVPAALLQGAGGSFAIGWVRSVGLLPISLGCWLLLDSVFARFVREGHGTLAPIDPPIVVVRGGAFQVVRNPMYIANIAIVAGSGIVFQSWRLLGWAAVISVAFHLFVILYEEPTLRRTFGNAYETYRRDVGRWVPSARRADSDATWTELDLRWRSPGRRAHRR